MPTDVKLGGIYPDAQPSHGKQTAASAPIRIQVNGGAAVPLIAHGTATIRALPGNGSPIYVGGSAVDDTNGMILQPEEDLADIHVADLSYYYVYILATGDGFAWIAETQ